MIKPPLLIFDLEGTLGDIFLKDSASDDQWMTLRPGLVDGLKGLRESSHNYRIALATLATSDAVSYFTEYIRKQGFAFDRVYDRAAISPNPPKGFVIMHFKDLSRIYNDFGIPPEELSDRVLVIEDLQLSHDEIFVGEKTKGDSRQSYIISQKAEDLIAINTAFHGKQYNTYGNPLPKEGQVPVVLLVPNPRSNNFKALRMQEITCLVNATYETGQGSFGKGFNELNRAGIIKLETDMLRSEQAEFAHLGPEAQSHPFVREVTADFKQKYLIMKPEGCPTIEYEVVIL